MFRVESRWLTVNPEISKYIKEQTNKWLTQFINNGIELKSKTLDLVKSDCAPSASLPNYYFIISFVSSLSFLAGYKFHKLIHN